MKKYLKIKAKKKANNFFLSLLMKIIIAYTLKQKYMKIKLASIIIDCQKRIIITHGHQS